MNLQITWTATWAR